MSSRSFLTLAVLGSLSVLICAGSADAHSHWRRPRIERSWRGPALVLSPLAQTRLGFAYQTGKGAPQNYVLAAYWYRQAAARGLPAAQFLLGLLYDRGLGVPLDRVLAEKWLVLAAGGATGREQDYYARIRDAIATTLYPEQIAEAQRLAYIFAVR